MKTKQPFDQANAERRATTIDASSGQTKSGPDSKGRVRHRTFIYDGRLEAYTYNRTDPQRLVGRHSLSNKQPRVRVNRRIPEPNQQQDTPVDKTEQQETLIASNRAHPFHTIYDQEGNHTHRTKTVEKGVIFPKHMTETRNQKDNSKTTTRTKEKGFFFPKKFAETDKEK